MSSMRIAGVPNRVVTDYLRHLLTSGKAGAVLTLRRCEDTGSYDYGLITDPDGLAYAVPLDPVMPVNGGEVLTDVTPSKVKVAAVLRPCEVRAFVERVKREQGSMENVMIISQTCSGTYPLQMAANRTLEEKLPEYFEAAEQGEIPEGIRPTCAACEHFVPGNTDITVSLAGEKDSSGSCVLYFNTEEGMASAEGFEGQMEDGEYDPGMVEKLLEKRLYAKDKLYASLMDGKKGLDALVDTFGKCVGCHGCGHVCPICYCVMCDFESRNFDYDMPSFEKELKQKKALRLPPDTIFFQLGRLTHMSFSCVGCGLCSDVCPADIPVSQVFKRIGEQTAGLFEYIAGRDVEEPIPVMVFKEEELLEFDKD